jgi:molecular chaperone DnaJ
LEPCPLCRGTGRITQGHAFIQIQSPCQHCDGKGGVVADPCPTCAGSGSTLVPHTAEVDVPPGAFHGLRINKRGEGDRFEVNGPTGDLHFLVRVKPHPIFARSGNDLTVMAPIPFSLAILGGNLVVPCLTDELLEVTIPPATQSGTMFRLAGKGFRDPFDHWVGDYLIKVEVETPKYPADSEVILQLQELEKQYPGELVSKFQKFIRPPDQPAS